MSQNTTDLIAKLAWKTTRERWREFMVLPAVVTIIVFGAVGALFYYIPLQGIPAVSISLIVLYLAYIAFCIVFYNALAKWCADLYAGKKVIDIEDGFRYGLSRFWGVLGTGLLTMLKILLWSLLLLLPGIYKGVMYFHSIQVSQLEKISGGDANRMSQKMISKSGFLRTIGNLMAIYFVGMILFYIYFGLTFAVSAGFIAAGSEILSGLISVALFGAGAVFLKVYLLVFFNYQYLIYRDENKAALAILAKGLKKMQ